MLGLKLLRGKLKEAVICLSAGRVTLPYPYAPSEPSASFRGLPQVDGARCIGCGGCASACPPNLITIADDGPLARFTWALARCTSCGRCADACPEDAVTMTRRFETATDQVADLLLTVDVFMASCNRCGRCYRTRTPLDPLDPRPYHEHRVQALCNAWKDRADEPRSEVRA